MPSRAEPATIRYLSSRNNNKIYHPLESSQLNPIKFIGAETHQAPFGVIIFGSIQIVNNQIEKILSKGVTYFSLVQ